MCISLYGYVCMNAGKPWRLEERARSSAAGVIGGSRLPNVGAGNYPEILCQSVTLLTSVPCHLSRPRRDETQPIAQPYSCYILFE